MDERALASIFQRLRKKRLNSQSGESSRRGSRVGATDPAGTGSISVLGYEREVSSISRWNG